MTEDEDALDTSWIEEYQQLATIQDNYSPEPMTEINGFFLYVDKKGSIQKIETEKIELVKKEDPEGSTRLPNGQLLYIIQRKKNIQQRYRLLDIFTYHVDLATEDIQPYSCDENYQEASKEFLKKQQATNDIHFAPSIFIFHEINAIYFLFEEIENPKSILKKKTAKNIEIDQEHASTSKTKKVSIEEKTNRRSKTAKKISGAIRA